MKNDNNDRAGMRAIPGRADGLRLVVSRNAGVAAQRTAIVPRPKDSRRVAGPIALLPGSWNVRFTVPRRPIAVRQDSLLGTQDKRRLDVRHKEGISMKAFERLIGTAGRFAVGFGSGLALVCAFVIVTTDLGEAPKVVRPANIVYLDTVVVTISADRFYELQAELRGRPVLVRTPDHGAVEG